MMSSHRMTEHLVSAQQLEAMRAYWTVPSTVANVVVNNSRFLVDAGPAFDYYWYSGGVWQDCIMADYVKHMNDPAQLLNGARPNVLTVYDGDFEDPATHRAEARVDLLTQPFSFYEDALRADLERDLRALGLRLEQGRDGRVPVPLGSRAQRPVRRAGPSACRRGARLAPSSAPTGRGRWDDSASAGSRSPGRTARARRRPRTRSTRAGAASRSSRR